MIDERPASTPTEPASRAVGRRLTWEWRRLRLPRTRALSAAALLSLCLLSAAAVTLRVRADPALSPVDELQHVDYLDRASHGHLVRVGEFDGRLARHEASCRTIEQSGFVAPPCDDSVHPANQYPELGIDTAASDPPVYYLTTGLAARLLRSALHLSSLVTAARLLGMVWLILGVVLTWAVMAELGAGLAGRLATGALMVTTPVVLVSGSTVTSDAVLVASGAGCLLAALLWERGRISPVVPLSVALVCGLLKITALVGVLPAALYLGWRAMRRSARTAEEAIPPRRGSLALGVNTAICGLLGNFGWLIVVHLRTIANAPVPNMVVAFHRDHLRLAAIVESISSTITPVDRAALLVPLWTSAIVQVAALLSAVLVAGVLGCVAWADRGSRAEALALSVTITMLVTGPLFVVALFVVQHAVIPDIPHRYALALLPSMLALLALALAKRFVRVALVGLAVVAVLVTFERLITV